MDIKARSARRRAGALEGEVAVHELEDRGHCDTARQHCNSGRGDVADDKGDGEDERGVAGRRRKTP